MKENSTPPSEKQHGGEPIDWHRLMLRKDRPLPKRGCSVAFYIFLAALLILFIIEYLIYRR